MQVLESDLQSEGKLVMRSWLFSVAAVLLIAAPAVGAETKTQLDLMTRGEPPITIYFKGHLASAYSQGIGTYRFGGTIGTIKGLGEVLTLGGASLDDIANLYVIQYPFVTGGWWKHYWAREHAQNLEASGTYTILGSAASMKRH
jgi:hypothetical protein